MATIASLDLSEYLQVISPPAWTCHEDRQTATVHNFEVTRSIHSGHDDVAISSPDDDAENDGFRSHDPLEIGASTSDLIAADSGFSSDSSEDTNPSPATRLRSPGKRVSFADDVGLALVRVLRYDVLPAVEEQPLITQRVAGRRRLRLEPGFQQPWFDATALRWRLDRDAVVLESAVSRGRGMLFAGTVVVANLAFEKRVTIRCTFDFWRSFVDVDAVYMASSSMDNDLFAFEVQPDTLAVPDLGCCKVSPRRGPGRDRFQFAVRYHYRSGGGGGDAVWTERWDNNDGRNYHMVATW